MRQKASTLISILLYGVFAVYTALMLFLLFFGRIGMRGMGLYSVNLIPFYTIGSQLSQLTANLAGFAVVNFFGNILLFTPLGIYLPVFWCGKKYRVYAACIFLISLTVEIIQWVFDLGAADIDDLILNCLGGFIGLAVYKILVVLLKDKMKVRTSVAVLSAIGGLLLATYIVVMVT